MSYYTANIEPLEHFYFESAANERDKVSKYMTLFNFVKNFSDVSSYS